MRDHILYKLQDLKSHMKSLNSEYLAYIFDKDYSIESRWDVYLAAPHEMKKHKSYIEHFKSLPDDFIGYDMPYYVEKYQTVNIIRLIERVLEYNDNFDENQGKLINIDMLKDEILQKNIGSFEFDW